MSYTLNNTIYPEELYSVPVRPVVVLSKPWEQTTEAEKILLEKILGLAQLSLRHVKIFPVQNLDLARKQPGIKKIIAFGIDHSGLPENEILDIPETKLIVTSDLISLETADKETKQKLANALRAF